MFIGSLPFFINGAGNSSAYILVLFDQQLMGFTLLFLLSYIILRVAQL
ncbi:hypothetical protein INT80_02560 [Gallibacterium anatis]|uniref:Uncharacterized protein n=1 Tax=Gallibacterium anatis TaxID=750 RepID=A0A930UW45_9PAST|nr:hypothetical protein [Gallibacterium anatis]